MPADKGKVKPATNNATLNQFFGKSSQAKSSQSSTQPNSQGQSKLSSQGSPSQNAKSIPISTSTTSVKRKSAIIVSDSDDEDSPPRKKVATPKAKTAPESAQPSSSRAAAASVPKKKSLIFSSDEDDNGDWKPPPKVSQARPNSKEKPRSSTGSTKPKSRSATNRKKATKVDTDSGSESDDIEEDPAPRKSKKSTPAKPANAKGKVKAAEKSRKATENGTSKVKQEEKSKVIVDDGPPKAKFDYAAKARRLASGPIAPGSKAIPDGKPNCLGGLSFVFTGELSAFSREEANDLVKRFGGRLTLQPSSKTSWVVLGSDAGPSKLAAIKKHNLPTLDEDGFLDLIRTREPVLDEKTKKKMKEEEEKVKQDAKEMEKREKKAVKSGAVSDPGAQLWTTKYAPQNLKEICGNKGQVEKIQRWLEAWPTSLKSGFKKPGKDMMGCYRALLISGPPGIGKTTSAHLCVQLAGYTAIELNASDTRSKKLIENAANINNTSLDGFLAGDKKTNVAGIEISNRSVLILDEVDGMSAGDRGGIGAMNALIKKTKIPIICIANDRSLQKMKPLYGTTFNLTFRRPDANMVRSRIKTIAFREKMNVPANVIDQLVAGTNSDIRQMLNLLATWKLSHNSMDFDESKELIRDNEKYSVMTPFNVSHKILGPYLFSPTARETLNEKMELYFHDMSLVPLFIQENYLKTQPAALRNISGPELQMKQLQIMDKAASSISDGDLVDALIHSPEQLWTLLPLHAALSTIRPASCVYGMGGGFGGPNASSFPAWLGQNSKQGKLQRQLGDIQVRMRLVVSGDKLQIRQSYIPALHPKLVVPLVKDGASAVPEIIETMDQYYLSKDDWDALVELGVGDNNEEAVLKTISSATKAGFTKKYNSSEHPIAFHKADLGKPAKKLGGGPAPDHEDVFDVEEDVEEEKEEKEVNPIAKDKLLKEAKSSKGKAKANSSPDDDGATSKGKSKSKK